MDYRKQVGEALVSIPYEFPINTLEVGQSVTVLDTLGQVLGNVPVVKTRAPKFADHAVLVKVRAPLSIAKQIAGIRVQQPWVGEAMPETVKRLDDDEIVCRMGACGGKTCPSLIARLFREEGVPPGEVTDLTRRPIFMEVPMGAFAGLVTGEGPVPDVAKAHAVHAFQGGL